MSCKSITLSVPSEAAILNCSQLAFSTSIQLCLPFRIYVKYYNNS